MSTNVQRLQFDFAKPVVQDIEILQEQLSCPTRGEVMRMALSFFKFLVHSVGTGADLYLVKDGKKTMIPAALFLNGRLPAEKHGPKNGRLKTVHR